MIPTDGRAEVPGSLAAVCPLAQRDVHKQISHRCLTVFSIGMLRSVTQAARMTPYRRPLWSGEIRWTCWTVIAAPCSGLLREMRWAPRWSFSPPGSFEPITDMVGGGPFGLEPGQWTDDTSMALCLAESLIESGEFDAVDQLARSCAGNAKGITAAPASASTSDQRSCRRLRSSSAPVTRAAGAPAEVRRQWLDHAPGARADVLRARA